MTAAFEDSGPDHSTIASKVLANALSQRTLSFRGFIMRELFGTGWVDRFAGLKTNLAVGSVAEGFV